MNPSTNAYEACLKRALDEVEQNLSGNKHMIFRSQPGFGTPGRIRRLCEKVGRTHQTITSFAIEDLNIEIERNVNEKPDVLLITEIGALSRVNLDAFFKALARTDIQIIATVHTPNINPYLDRKLNAAPSSVNLAVINTAH